MALSEEDRLEVVKLVREAAREAVQEFTRTAATEGAKAVQDATAAAKKVVQSYIGTILQTVEENIGWPGRSVFTRIQQALRAQGLI